MQVAWITTSNWLKLRASHKYTQQWPTCCKAGLPWTGKSCNLYRFPSRWKTTLYFPQHVFATCNDSMKCIDYRFCSLSSLFLVADPRIRFRAWKAVESWASCKENGRCSERVTVKRFVWGKKDGSVVRALASHQFGVGWVCCRFSSLLREVFLRVLRFPPLLKNQHFQVLIRSGTHGHVSTSSYEFSSAPWVNKLQFAITIHHSRKYHNIP